MKAENKKYLIYGAVAFLVGSVGYFVYTTISKRNSRVVKDASTDETIDTTPTQAPKVNPFTNLLGKKFAPISFKPTDYSVKNPFADVNTAIASVNPFSSTNNTNERLA
jgi:hypothetical protein